MKKKLLITALVLVVLVAGMVIKMKNTRYETISATMDLSTLADGSYKGVHEIKPVKVELEVTVKENRIAGVEIIKHNCGLGKKAEAIVDDIIAKQSLDVDSISGATVSSNVIKKAIEEALK